MKITVETTIAAPLEAVWRAWTTPHDIMQWNAASDDWHTTAAAIDLRPGGRFSYRMEARDGTAGFDFAGTYTKVVPYESIEFMMDEDHRVALSRVHPERARRHGPRNLDAEGTYGADQQRAGWQAIPDRFAGHVEALQ